jgi:hypothetical protein
MTELQDGRTLVEVLEDFPELMGERPGFLTDPFLDDEPLGYCGLEDIEVCDSCQ